jgi:hypothetical protein
MTIGCVLGWRKFPVSCERVVISRIWCSDKATQILELRVRESGMGWGRGQESKVSARSTPNPSHGTKMLGKTPLTKKTHEKSLTSKSKV